jgi:hypothetical protein
MSVEQRDDQWRVVTLRQSNDFIATKQCICEKEKRA